MRQIVKGISFLFVLTLIQIAPLYSFASNDNVVSGYSDHARSQPTDYSGWEHDFMIYAVDGSNSVENDTSNIITESITDDTPPAVLETNPADGGRRVQVASVINVTFSEPMNEDTINSDTFILTNEIGDQVFGTIDYQSENSTASFSPDEPLIFGLVYSAELTDGIQDIAGNSLDAHSWTFTTGGQIRIFVRDIESFNLINGSGFTITPNPFTLANSLLVEDNGPLDSDASVFGEARDGIIVVDNVENSFVSYRVTESTPPTGYSSIWGDALITVVEALECDLCNPITSMTVDNLNTGISITDIDTTISVPAPHLNQSQFALYRDNVIVGRFSGMQGDIDAITDVQSPNPPLPSAQIATSTTIDELMAVTLFESLNFFITASPSISAQEIFENFAIPTYPAPVENLADQVIFWVPAAVIPYEGSKNNFILSPIIENVYSGEQLVIIQPSFVETNIAKVERINMTFNIEASNVGFSFGVTNTPPPGTPDPPLDAPALFLDIGFVGEGDFSDPTAFQTSPKIDVLVNKTLPGFPELPNGCPDFKLLFFDGSDWVEVQKLNPVGNFTDFCPFTLEPEHFSKFAVGGVKGQTISTESSDDERRSGGGGGGGSRSTAVTSTSAGDDIETSVNTQSGEVQVRFDSVEAGGGQLKINSNELSSFEDLFDELAYFREDNDEHGVAMIEGKTYTTTGDIFDIDASAIDFDGIVHVTIPYDESPVTLFGTENNVRFIHYNEELQAWEDKTQSVDENANTVTGELDSLSPVASAIIIDDVSANTDQDNTMLWIRSTNPSLSVSESGQVALTLDLDNMRSIEQEYIVLVQIVDRQNVAQFIEWRAGSIEASKESETSMNWDGLDKGQYNVQVLILSELENPRILSEVIHTNLII